MENIKIIDLFAGIGGFRQAFQFGSQDVECVFSSEMDPSARKTYAENYHNGDESHIGGDITQYPVADIPSHDILCGGFPCQPFSIAGQQEGFNDDRGQLFFRIADIIEHHRPNVVFLENVKNLFQHDGGNTFKVILKVLEQDLGYHVAYQILNASTHGGLPQNRERIYIVGFKNLEDKEAFRFPDMMTADDPDRKTLDDVIDWTEKKPDKYYQTNLESPSVVKMLENITEEGYIYQYRRYYVRKNNNRICPTLTANMGLGGHNVPLLKDRHGIRKLTPQECFAIQGFPSDFKIPKLADNHLYKQAGNSVPVPVVRKIAQNILQVLLNNELDKENTKDGSHIVSRCY